jgi:DNA-binding beta-propeller fold protein YncE
LRAAAAVAALIASGGAHAGSAAPNGARVCGTASLYDVAVPGAPFSAVATADEKTVFVSLNATNPRQQNGIGVLACAAGRYHFARMIPLESQPTIMAMTHDGRMLIVPDDSYIAFIDVRRAITGSGDPLLGYIEDVPGDDGGAVYAAVSPDDKYAFISEEQSAKLTVIDLRKLRTSHFAHASIVSEFLIGNSPVALVFSRDGKYLFATVQEALNKYAYAKTCKPEGRPRPGAADESPGSVVTIDVAKAVGDPDHAIVSDVVAGCHPVRAALTPDGATLWVSARASNAVLAFSTAKLLAGDASAKLAEVAVGAAPVPVYVTPDGTYVLAGNSNRFGQGRAGDQEAVVIDTRSNAVAGRFHVGKFPRQFTQTRSGSTIFLSNYGSNTVTVIDPKAIASIMKPAP